MKAKDLKNLSLDQLRTELYKLREESAKISVKTSSNQQKNVHAGKVIKKDIARILTQMKLLSIQNN